MAIVKAVGFHVQQVGQEGASGHPGAQMLNMCHS